MILRTPKQCEVGPPVLDKARELTEQLANLTRFLPRPERQIVGPVLARGRSLADVARRQHLTWMSAKRAFCRAVRRMASRPFQLAARNLDRLTGEEREFVTRAVLGGQSIRRLAEDTGSSIHAVRKRLAGVRAKLGRLEADRPFVRHSKPGPRPRPRLTPAAGTW